MIRIDKIFMKGINILFSSYDELDTDDLYVKFKKLQQQLEFLQVQEEYIKVFIIIIFKIQRGGGRRTLVR